MMDLLFWNNLNSNIKINSTHKQYYGKYLWRVLLKVPGGRLIYSKFDSLDEAIEHRRAQEVRLINWGGSWIQRRCVVDVVNQGLLYRLREYQKINKHVRIRVEEPWIQVYAETESDLKGFALHFDQYPGIFHEMHGVDDPERALILKSDSIIVSTPPKWRYKIMLRDGMMEVSVKKSLLQYLVNLEDQVEVSSGTQHQLEREYNNLWGGFMYTNDLNIVTFINLISPGLIRKIHELVYLDQ
jgi:hypothetical protein